MEELFKWTDGPEKSLMCAFPFVWLGWGCRQVTDGQQHLGSSAVVSDPVLWLQADLPPSCVPISLWFLQHEWGWGMEVISGDCWERRWTDWPKFWEVKLD